MDIWYKSLRKLPVQSVLRVPVQKLRALNERERILLHLRLKVLQLQLANTVAGFVFSRLSAFPQQKQQNI